MAPVGATRRFPGFASGKRSPEPVRLVQPAYGREDARGVLSRGRERANARVRAWISGPPPSERERTRSGGPLPTTNPAIRTRASGREANRLAIWPTIIKGSR